jgi:prepilin-type N-terminal cleavage/methylation domain-containing protein
MKTSPTKRAFTMTEMLTVIAVIGVLLALLFPAIKSSILKAETNKAQVAISSLATALKAYYTEYGQWPIAYVLPTTVPTPSPYEDFIVDHNVIALLSGQDPSSPTYPGGANPLAWCDTGRNGLAYGQSPGGATIRGNPRHIVFLEFKQADIRTSSIVDNNNRDFFSDPWSKPYHFRLDVTYQNQVDYPFTGPAVAVRTLPGIGSLIWSVGPDGQYNQNDTLATVLPLAFLTQNRLNKDNVTSW